MIVRIVRMHFRASEVTTFLQIFEANKEAIRNFPGCTHLELLRDFSNQATFTTIVIGTMPQIWKNTENRNCLKEFGYV